MNVMFSGHIDSSADVGAEYPVDSGNRREGAPVDSGNLQGRPTTVVYSNITTPPVLVLERYEDWKKSTMWWTELHAGIDEARLLAEVGVHATGVAKGILQDYFESTKLQRFSRTVKAYIDCLDVRFRRPAEERATQRISQRGQMRKKPTESYKEYWTRFDRLKYNLMGLGITWPGKIAFSKASESLSLTQEHQTLVKAALELSADSESMAELQRVTSKLSDVHSQKIEDICFNDLGETIHGWEFVESEWEHEWALTPVRKAKGKAKSGNKVNSVRGAVSAFGYSPLGKGGKQTGSFDQNCRNCNKPGHWWGNCPNLTKKPTVFPKGTGKGVKSGDQKGEKSPTVDDTEVNTLLADVPTEDDDQHPDLVEDTAVHLRAYANQTETEEYDPWDGTYALFPVEEQKQWIWVGAETSMLTSMYRKALVDCGASATVCGCGWIKAWCTSFRISELPRSAKKFRFGDGHGCQSLGFIFLRASVQGRIAGKWIPIGIQTDVVEGEVPLLLSLSSLGKLEGVINCTEQSLGTRCGEFQLTATNSGHLRLDLLPPENRTMRRKSL